MSYYHDIVKEIELFNYSKAMSMCLTNSSSLNKDDISSIAFLWYNLGEIKKAYKMLEIGEVNSDIKHLVLDGIEAYNLGYSLYPFKTAICDRWINPEFDFPGEEWFAGRIIGIDADNINIVFGNKINGEIRIFSLNIESRNWNKFCDGTPVVDKFIEIHVNKNETKIFLKE